MRLSTRTTRSSTRTRTAAAPRSSGHWSRRSPATKSSRWQRRERGRPTCLLSRSAREQGDQRPLGEARRANHHDVVLMPLEEVRRPLGSLQPTGEVAAQDQALLGGCRAVREELLEAEGRDHVAAHVGVRVGDALEAVDGARLDDDLAVLWADHALLRPEPQLDPPVEHRPALLL